MDCASLVSVVAALTTKRARVRAVSSWIRAHAADAQLAEGALQALLDHAAARLFADEGPAVTRFKAGLATLYVVDEALKADQEGAAPDAQRAARGFADACERTRHVARLVRNLARFLEDEAGDEPRLVDVGAGVARLIAIWAARRALSEETLAKLREAVGRLVAAPAPATVPLSVAAGSTAERLDAPKVPTTRFDAAAARQRPTAIAASPDPAASAREPSPGDTSASEPASPAGGGWRAAATTAGSSACMCPVRSSRSPSRSASRRSGRFRSPSSHSASACSRSRSRSPPRRVRGFANGGRGTSPSSRSRSPQRLRQHGVATARTPTGPSPSALATAARQPRVGDVVDGTIDRHDLLHGAIIVAEGLSLEGLIPPAGMTRPRRRLHAGSPVRVRVAYSFPTGCPSHRWRWEATMHGVPQPADRAARRPSPLRGPARGRGRGASPGFDRSRSRDWNRGSRPQRSFDEGDRGGRFDRRDGDCAAPLRPRRCPPPGTLIDGVVDRVRACGAFVRVPGEFSDGLLPTSQQDRTARPGDRVCVRVMDNKGAEKWSCTTRVARAQPAAPSNERAGVPGAPVVAASRNDQHLASQAGSTDGAVAGAERTEAGATAEDAPAVEEGGIYAGACSNVAPYGAFVALDRGGEGLLHRSKVRDRLPAKGDRLFVRVLQIKDDGKVAFSTLGLDAAAGAPAPTDDGAIEIDIDVGTQRQGAKKSVTAEVWKTAQRPQADVPVGDFDVKSFAEVMAEKRGGVR